MDYGGELVEQISVAGELGASAGEVWTLVGDFVGLLEVFAEPMGASVESEGEGVGALRWATLSTDSVRQLVGEDAGDAMGYPGRVVERLDELDNPNMRLVYSLVEAGPLPLAKCTATIQLAVAGQGRSRVTWTGTFEPAGVSNEVASKVLRDMYSFAIETLQKRFGS
jgi:hypothetical protein